MEHARSKFSIIFLTFVIFLALNCSQSTIQRKYYLLDYPGVPKDSSLVVDYSFPFKVMVQTMKIPRTYDRTNIVVRYSAHQIDYYRYSLWAIKPQVIISDLIAQQLQSYKLFLKCKREFLDENPDFEVVGYIQAIERFHNEAFSAAHLAMTLYLRRSDDFSIVVRHKFDREEELFSTEMTYFSKKLSDILREEIDKFVIKIINSYQSLKLDNSGEINEENIP